MTRVRQVAPWAIAVALNVLLFVPAFVFSQPRPSLLRVSFEYGVAVLALGLAAPTRLRTPCRVLVVALYAGLLLFLTYHHAYHYFFLREPAVVEDWRLLLNLLHLVGEMTSPRWMALVAACVLFSVGLVVLLERVFAALQRRMVSRTPRLLGLAAAGCLLLGVASFVRFGFVSEPLAANYRASVEVKQKLEQLHGAPPDQRNLPLIGVRLAKKPNVYLLMIEAYGEVLATWDMTEPYRALMSRVEARLKAAGYTARTAYSAAPVYGGRSWFSIATVHTGILVDQPQSYAALEPVAGDIPTLTKFFRAQGYHTLSLQPGTAVRAGLPQPDLFKHERLIDASEIGYRGRRWGFFTIPDQYSLGAFRERYPMVTDEPHYWFFMSVSTHFPWIGEVPPYVRDWKTLDGAAPEAVTGDPRWPPLPGVDKIASELRSAYLRSIEYEWRVLTDMLEKDPSKELVVIVVGDHQPRLESNPPGEVTFNSPVHVISRDPTFVERFAQTGFQPGLYAEPGRTPVLQHEGLFSLLVKKLAEAYGTSATKGLAQYFPGGIGLAGLNQ
jgi:hypothetical protein